ncbi:acyltransferase [Marinomonas sp. IMCC 4694]|uniref:acyltransferase n=1 Tax=Marinomonas sp. IMCC 4694 TaxID=2605432 RepID=UPI0011E71269|nr:acyltransferase [Marinomonas sp. IMCC 4694]TYL46622.1 acyltransferase [Marinomonas sp. IMCC 4694]
MNFFKKYLLLARNTFKIKGHHHIDIATDVRIRQCKITIKGKNNTLIMARHANLRGVNIELIGDNCTLSIGEGCVIGEGCYLSSREKGTQLILGAGCMLSRNVNVMTSDGHDILREGKRINPAKSIFIGDRVWLADSVTVLKGVTIGNDCIVGINSTLTKSIDSGSVAAGVPAKVVSHGVTWQNECTF